MVIAVRRHPVVWDGHHVVIIMNNSFHQLDCRNDKANCLNVDEIFSWNI